MAAEPERDRESFDVDVSDDPSWRSPVVRVPHESDVASRANEAIFEPVDEDEAVPDLASLRGRASIRVSQPPRRTSEPASVPPRKEPGSAVVGVAGGAQPASPHDDDALLEVASPSSPEAAALVDVVPATRTTARVADVELATTAMPSSFVPRSPGLPETRRSAKRFVVPALFLSLGVSLAIGARWWRYQELARAEAMARAEAPDAAAPGVAALVVLPPDPEDDGPSHAMTPTPKASESSVSTPSNEDVPVELALSPREQKRLSATQGLVEIVAGKKDEIFLDGRRVGQGPVQRVALEAGDQKHEVRVKLRGEERVRYVTPKAGVKLRLRIAPPWTR